jgi:hypothetical protein
MTLLGAAKFIASLRDKTVPQRLVEEQPQVSDVRVVCAATLAVAAVCLVDSALDGGAALLGAACAGLGAGVAVGLFLCVARRFLGLLPAPGVWTVWIIAGSFFVRQCFLELQLLPRLRSQYALLAAIASLISVVAGAVIVVGGIRSPLAAATGTYARVLTARQLSVRAISLVTIVGVLLRLDRFLPATNIGFTGVVHWAALASAIYGTLFWLPWRGPRAWTYRTTLPLLAGLILPFLVLHPDRLDHSELLQHRASLRSIQLLRSLTDFDRDGYSSWLGDGDCAGWSASIGPGMDEVPGNGVDENCQLGDAKVPRAIEAATPSHWRPDQESPSVVLVTVDTLSANHMSLHGYHRPTTPNIASWAARRGIVFDNALSPGTSTIIALSSVFRGVYPRRLDWSTRIKSTSNRFVTHPDALDGAAGERPFRTLLVPALDKRPTLSELLRVRGYRTVSLTAVEPPSLFARELNVAGAFDEQIASPTPADGAHADKDVTRLALDTLDTLRVHPFFLWIHYYGPHTPNARHANIPEFGPSVVDDYDHEIAALDEAIAPLLLALERRQDSGENVVLLLTADHGEDCSESKRAHADSTARSVLHVPLVVAPARQPGLPVRRVARTVSTLDVFATLLDSVGAPIPVGVDSKSLLVDFTSGSKTIFSEGWLYDSRGSRVVENIVAAKDACQLTRDNLTRAWRATGSCDAESVAALRREMSQHLEIRTTIHER